MDNWRTASYSNANGGQCVEVASAESVTVRDSVDREGGMLNFTAEAWQEFIGQLR
jgi:hypothetical protein